MKVNIEVRKCRGRDIKEMKGKLRKEDVLEIERKTGREPYRVLIESYRKSDIAFVGLVDNEIACAWGVAKESILSDESTIWLLSTEVMKKAPVAVAKKTKMELDKLLQVYPKIGNYVDSEYSLCIRWLCWLGFTVENPEPIGVRGGLFSKFYIARDNI